MQEDFYSNLFSHKLFVKLPERTDDGLSAATQLLEKRREVAEVEQSLVAQKDEFGLKMENLARRREELQRKEYLLKESLLKFDKFVKENDAKKQRAIKRQLDERDARFNKEREIESLREQIVEMNDKKEQLAMQATKYSAYQIFLDKTVDISAEFQEVRDLMGRFDTLSMTHETLLAGDAENQVIMQSERQLLTHYIEKKLNEKLLATAMLSELQERRDQLESECHRLETNWLQIQSSAAARTLELGRIGMATHNLFHSIQQINTEHHQENNARMDKDLVGQLDDIQRCILDLTDIVNRTQQMILEEETSRLTRRSSVSRRISRADFSMLRSAKGNN